MSGGSTQGRGVRASAETRTATSPDRRFRRSGTAPSAERKGAGGNAQLLEALPDPALLLDGGRIAAANHLATALLGEGLPGTQLDRWLAPGACWPEGPAPAQVPFLAADGWRLRLEVQVRPVPGREGERLCLLRDREAADVAHLLEVQRERLGAVRRLAAALSHELNNPLAFVTANLRYLQDVKACSEPAHQEALDEAQLGTERCAAVLRELRERLPVWSERTPLEMEPLLRWLAAHTAAGSCPVELQLEGPLPPVVGERGLVAETLQDLLAHAAAGYERSGPIRIAAWASPGYLTIEVRDSGRPLSQEETRLSLVPGPAPHRQQRPRLALAALAAEALGGTLRLQSGPGGVCARLTLCRAS